VSSSVRHTAGAGVAVQEGRQCEFAQMGRSVEAESLMP
jgi:hypothetical protein